MALNVEELTQKLSDVLLKDNGEELVDGLDQDLVEYLAGLLSEADDLAEESVDELMDPFFESVDVPDDLQEQAKQVVINMVTYLAIVEEKKAGAKKLRQGVVTMKLEEFETEADQDANRFLWGTDSKVHEMTNASMDAKQQSSSKDRRKAKQDLERARREFASNLEQAQGEAGAVSAMLLPDYTSGRNERDVQIKNVSLSLDNGRLLLNGGELKFAHKRRYGLVGKVSRVFLALSEGFGQRCMINTTASRYFTERCWKDNIAESNSFPTSRRHWRGRSSAPAYSSCPPGNQSRRLRGHGIEGCLRL